MAAGHCSGFMTTACKCERIAFRILNTQVSSENKPVHSHPERLTQHIDAEKIIASTGLSNPDQVAANAAPNPVPSAKRTRPERSAAAAAKRPVASKRRVGKEAVKAGMATSLGVAMLTGLKILKPMSLHGPASWIFVGLTLVHTLVYELPNKSRQ
jgi:hypothetical protein